MWDKNSKHGCKHVGCCRECGFEPKTREEKLEFLQMKESKFKRMLEKIEKAKEAVKAGKQIEED